MNTIQYIRKHTLSVSIFLFIIIFGIIQMLKPTCFYNKDGSIREFGIGYRNKTIFPIWLLSLTLGILCYLALLYYINIPILF
jgi:uncharacterized membrane protein YidH (DUF202 family)